MYILNETYAGSVCWKMQNADEINQSNLNKWRDTPCPWTGRLNTVKISALFKPICRFKVVLIKVPARFRGDELCVCPATQSCLTLRPHGPQPTRLLCPWDSSGKNTWEACHFLFQGISCLFCIGRQTLYHWATCEALCRHRQAYSKIYMERDE